MTEGRREFHVARRALELVIALLLAWGSSAWADDFAQLSADRKAVERVYYNHRLGEKPPFEQTLSAATLETLVRQDLRKEAALKRSYGIQITAAMLDAEVQRINTSTRAPDVLAELKAALGNDPHRFAASVARSMLVERLLREKFDNDDALHAPQRRQMEQARNELLAAKTNGADAATLLAQLQRSHSSTVTETTWQLGPRPASDSAPAAAANAIKRQFGPNAQIMAPGPADEKRAEFYFEDLPGELQNVLQVQLRRPGDISAVIETPGGFLLYLALERTDKVLRVAGVSIPKRSYEQWLSEQTEVNP